MRDAVDVVKSKIRPTLSEPIITLVAVSSSVRIHPMNSNLGHTAIKEDIVIKLSLVDGVFWWTKESSDVKSVVCFLQAYSEKSQVNMKPSSFTLSLLFLLNCSISQRRRFFDIGQNNFASQCTIF